MSNQLSLDHLRSFSVSDEALGSSVNASSSAPSTRFVVKFDNRKALKLGLSGTSSPDGRAVLVEAIALSGDPGKASRKSKLIVPDGKGGMRRVVIEATTVEAMAAKAVAKPMSTEMSGTASLPVVDLTRKTVESSKMRLAAASLSARFYRGPTNQPG